MSQATGKVDRVIRYKRGAGKASHGKGKRLDRSLQALAKMIGCENPETDGSNQIADTKGEPGTCQRSVITYRIFVAEVRWVLDVIDKKRQPFKGHGDYPAVLWEGFSEAIHA